MKKLSHIDEKGQALMVDVSKKPVTERTATASCQIRLSPETLELITEGKIPKGDVFSTARIAGIMAAKQTPRLIPLCHQINLASVEIEFVCGEGRISITAKAKASDRTGVEMEALTAASVAALTIYDMCKAVERGIIIEAIRLEEKSGGREDYRRVD
ncbi:MAG TPA: cyclic pyranopterin monophosphate synthase MoaC [Pyrinomonadaceae bacterium]|nr:cyclic pyranopterin monophosphate synthase MoaC [Pyrinomonadaceae bacterium]